MYDNNNPNPSGGQVSWNGSSYSGGPFRMEDLRGPSSSFSRTPGPDPATPTPPAKPSKKKRGKGVLKAVALVLCCALIGGSAGFGGAALYGVMFPSESQSGSASSGEADNSGKADRPGHSGTTIFENITPPTTTVNLNKADGITQMTLTEIYNAYVNSCVVITCQVTYTTNTWYGPYSGTATSAGSGFVISDNGYIVTNYHVIDGADTIKVTFYNGEEYEATFVGGEESNDVAVLKIDATGLTPVVLGDSDNLSVGEPVSTIGNALGTLSFSQTSGAVSGLGRSVTYSDGTIISMLQTDCTINSGNSGGPLFDQYGRVVGITSAKYSNNADSSAASIENIGFAIPINDVKTIITDILEHGYVIRPYMGITVATITEEYARTFGWPYGAYVNSVEENSCAEKAGLRKGDIITKVGDTEVATSAELTAAKNKYAPGDTVELTVYRGGEEIVLSITFDKSENPTAGNNNQSSGEGQSSSSQNNGQSSQGRDPFNSFPFGF